MENFSIEGTLFLYDLTQEEVTVITWGGQEARFPVAHMEAFLSHWKLVLGRKKRRLSES